MPTARPTDISLIGPFTNESLLIYMIYEVSLTVEPSNGGM